MLEPGIKIRFSRYCWAITTFRCPYVGFYYRLRGQSNKSVQEDDPYVSRWAYKLKFFDSHADAIKHFKKTESWAFDY